MLSSTFQVVIPKFAGDPAQGLEGMDVTTHEGFETLAMGKLQVQFAAVAFHQTEGIELARVAVVLQRAEVAPVDLETLSGRRFHAHVGPLRAYRRSSRV